MVTAAIKVEVEKGYKSVSGPVITIEREVGGGESQRGTGEVAGMVGRVKGYR